MRPQVQVLIADNNNYEPQNARNRYSYLNTPAEFHAPTFPPQDQQQRHPSLPVNAADQPLPPPLDHYAHTRSSSNMPTIVHHDVPEKSASLHAHTQTAPPLSEHPAQFAPYADSNPEHTTIAPRDSKVAPFPQPPPSIAVLPSHDQFANKPLSAAQEQERREKDMAILPDTNPLESHTSFTKPGPKSIKPSYPMTPITIPDTYDLSHFPGQVPHPTQRLKGDTWNYGLCDCSDIGTCCLGLFCPCILYGRTQYRLNRKSDRKDPTNLLGYETCNASCTAMALLCGCQWLLASVQHSRIRRAYGIPGSIPSDCVRATCCTCCTLIQDEREIKTREEGVRETVSTPYLPPSHMTFSPPPR
ncbi:hypothetical protein RJZ56_004775 [Blastomyces dermatitidis]|nr:hypothetical protein BDFG_00856 [Blastomyces dermatitidis ATCC 26199]EQL37810.1 hypothetical protein, variant 1 [Blastomyces dermatitidis ATCC 26199]EQL37811.1 hypothetical protein, variant 2 [Blastomyces dermatitidis ATCC 26199]EQL37812.1 hypothetical protein, variant 3 [Blastomyces dermatitidis ATCC 26199]EQL37813.1 hypothetical protein, variant 4 [Blastomyces dermatitidis ATCC 26199]